MTSKGKPPSDKKKVNKSRDEAGVTVVGTIGKVDCEMHVSLTKENVLPSSAGTVSIKFEKVKGNASSKVDNLDVVILLSHEHSALCDQFESQQCKKPTKSSEKSEVRQIRIGPNDLYFVSVATNWVMLCCKKLGCKLVFVSPAAVSTFKRVYIYGFLASPESGFCQVSQQNSKLCQDINEHFRVGTQQVSILANFGVIDYPTIWQHKDQKFKYYAAEANLCHLREMLFLLSSRILDVRSWIEQQPKVPQHSKVLNDLETLFKTTQTEMAKILQAADGDDLKIVLKNDWDKPVMLDGSGKETELPSPSVYKSKYNQWFRTKGNFVFDQEKDAKSLYNMTVDLELLSNSTGSPWIEHKIILHPKDVLFWKETHKPVNAAFNYGQVEQYTLTVYRLSKREFYHIRHSNRAAHDKLMLKFTSWLKKSQQDYWQLSKMLDEQALKQMHLDTVGSAFNLTWNDVQSAMGSLWGKDARLSYGYGKEIHSNANRWDTLKKVLLDDLQSFLVKWFGKVAIILICLMAQQQAKPNTVTNSRLDELFSTYNMLSQKAMASLPKDPKDAILKRAKNIASYIHYENPE